MATRYYIVGGAYYTWEQLHNQFGYTDHETANISYKSANTITWGDSAGSGYFDGDQTDMVNGSFWSDEDPTAWFDLSGLVYNAEVYPADATDCAMEKDGVQSDAVSIESDGVTYYLIRNVWDSGWMSESEAAAEGWEPAQPGPVLPVVYTHTGTQTAASIAPDASFDTGLTYDSNNLYIGETDDGLGDVTRYGWEAEEGPEPPAYTEITLYLQSGNKKAQGGVTSSYTGTVSSTYCYQLYTDPECTIPWKGYDYSNDYELGRYVDGVWTPRTRQTVADMPATTTGNYDYVFGRILLDTGELWHVTNYQLEGTTSQVNPIVRIYPKAQQHYALYFNYNSIYGNYSLGASRPGYPWPSGSSGNYMAWFASYPVPSFVKFLGSAGNEFLSGGDVGTISISNNSSNALTVTRTGYTNNISVRCAIFTLDSPTLFAWTRADKTNRTMSSGTVDTLYDENGNVIAYDDLYSYKILGVLQATGANCSGERNVIQYASMLSSNSALAFKQTYGSVTAAKIWYIKTPKPITT